MRTRNPLLVSAAALALLAASAFPATSDARRPPPAKPKAGQWADPLSPQPLLFTVERRGGAVKVKKFNAYIMVSCTTVATGQTFNYLFNTVAHAPTMTLRRVGRHYETVANYTDDDVSRRGAVRVAISFNGRTHATVQIQFASGGEESCSGDEAYSAETAS